MESHVMEISKVFAGLVEISHTIAGLIEISNALAGLSSTISPQWDAYNQMESHVMEISNAFGGISSIISRQRDADDAAKFRDSFLRALAYQEMYHRYESLNPRYDHTLEWLVDETSELCKENQRLCQTARSKLITWFKSGGGIFHVTGKPGSGKSTLIKYLSESRHSRRHLKVWAGGKCLVIGRFFISDKKSDRANLSQRLYRGLLHSIVKDLPIPDAVRFISLLFPEQWEQKLENKRVKISDNDVKTAFANLRNKSTLYDKHRFIIYIDGLDAYGGDCWELRRDLATWADFKPQDVKIFVTSHVNYTDIYQFVTRRLTGHRPYLDRVSELDRKRLQEKIARRSEGVFLWAHLVICELNLECEMGYFSGLEGLEHLVNTIPRELEL